MDPWKRLWYYECWVAEQEREFELARAQSILIGSFSNPEAARSMIKADNPDIVTSLSEEEASDELRKRIKEEDSTSKKKRRRPGFLME